MEVQLPLVIKIISGLNALSMDTIIPSTVSAFLIWLLAMSLVHITQSVWASRPVTWSCSEALPNTSVVWMHSVYLQVKKQHKIVCLDNTETLHAQCNTYQTCEYTLNIHLFHSLIEIMSSFSSLPELVLSPNLHYHRVCSSPHLAVIVVP